MSVKWLHYLDVTIPCVEFDGKQSSLQLEFVNPEKIDIPSGVYWKSSGFEDIACQPAPSVCATLDVYLNLRIPIKFHEVTYIAHLGNYQAPHLGRFYWKYRYHYKAPDLGLKSKALSNETAYIPSQCYTKTLDNQGVAHNPCFTCHHASRSPNYNNDMDLQESYAFPDYALTNHWTNLFKDRSQQVAAISDEEILAYIRKDNYKDNQGNLILRHKLQNLPAAWDFDDNGKMFLFPRLRNHYMGWIWIKMVNTIPLIKLSTIGHHWKIAI